MIENSQSSRASDLYRIFGSPPLWHTQSRFLTLNCAIQSAFLSALLFSILLASFITRSTRSHDVEKSPDIGIFSPPAQSFTAIFTTCHRCHARLENLLIASNLIGLRPFIQFQDMASVNSTSFLGSWKKDANRPIGMQLMGFLCRARLSAPSTSSPLKIGTRWHSSNFNCNRKDDKLQCIAEVWQFWPLNFFLEKLCIRSTPYPVSDF